MDLLTVRAATHADIHGVLSLWKAAAHGVSITDDHRGVGALIGRDPEALLLAERQEAVVGTVIAGFDGWRCHLYRLAVHPEHRCQGVGKALLAAAEERFTRLGGRRADAMVLKDNLMAHRAWGGAGYVTEPQWGRWVKPLPGRGTSSFQ